MRSQFFDHPRGLAAAARGAGITAILFATTGLVMSGCNGGGSSPPAGEDETGGTGGASSSTGGKGGGDHPAGGSAGRGQGGTPGATGGGGSSGGNAANGGSDGSGGNGGTIGAGGGAGADQPIDAGEPDAAAGGTGGTAGGEGGAPACGMAGQACCAGNTCMAGATPAASGEPGGMVVLELKASGGDPYAYFASKNLMPIDGPASGFITDTGTSFQFVIHQNGAEEVVSSGAHRQRNELTVNPGNPAMYKGMHGDTMSYTWRFRLDKMNANPTWCDIFQVKQHGTLGPAPFMAFEANKGDLTVDTQRLGVVARVPLSTIMGVWINASVTATYSETGSLAFTLKKDDGTMVLSYSNKNINLWGAGLDFVRPKWGFYRNQAAGAGEAQIQYNDMRIIRGTVGGTCSCH